MANKIKNILARDSILEDKLRNKQLLLDLIDDFKRSGEETAELEEALYVLEKDIANFKRRNNPTDSKWAYRGATMDEFENIVHDGVKTSFNPAIGRGVEYTFNPKVAIIRGGTGGQLLRFPAPKGGKVVNNNIGNHYSHFVSSPIHRRDVEVFLSGDINDDDSWVSVGALR